MWNTWEYVPDSQRYYDLKPDEDAKLFKQIWPLKLGWVSSRKERCSREDDGWRQNSLKMLQVNTLRFDSPKFIVLLRNWKTRSKRQQKQVSQTTSQFAAFVFRWYSLLFRCCWGRFPWILDLDVLFAPLPTSSLSPRLSEARQRLETHQHRALPPENTVQTWQNMAMLHGKTWQCLHAFRTFHAFHAFWICFFETNSCEWNTCMIMYDNVWRKMIWFLSCWYLKYTSVLRWGRFGSAECGLCTTACPKPLGRCVGCTR